VGGKDVGVANYLGWQNHAVNVTVTPDDSTGTYAGSNEQIVGAAVYTGLVSIAKGEPHCVDVIRYGRCDAVFEYGDATNGYCTLEEFARANDANDISFTADTTNADATLTNIATGEVEKLYPGAPLSGTGIPASTTVKYIASTTSVEMTANATATNTSVSITSQPYNVWGLIQKVSGGYLWKGLMQFGTASNAVDFRDSNRIIFLQWCPKVTSNFNTIEIVNASSRVDMTNFQFIQLDTSTASRGRWITTNDADVNLESVSYQDMGTFTYDSNTTALNCSWVRCDQIDPGRGDLSFSNVLTSNVTGGGSTGGGALLWNDSADPNTYLNDMTFTKGSGSHHAIEFGTSAPTTINLTNMTFTNFSASDQQTTSVLYFPDTGSDTTWTVNHSGSTGTISYYKARSGDTVTIAASAPVTITVKDESQTVISGARVGVYTNDASRTEIINSNTNASGVASGSWTGSTPQSAEVRARYSPSGSTRYLPFSQIATISGSGLSLDVTLREDPNA
jgi:hypothetical protein